MKTVLWIGGWASQWPALKPWLLPLAPDAIWISLDPHDLARHPVHLTSILDSLPGPGPSAASPSSPGFSPDPTLILAWSLGTLLLLRHLQVTQKKLAVPAVLLAPVDQLAGPGRLWPERALTRMRRRLRENKSAVLADFYRTMAADPIPGEKSGAPREDRAFSRAWLEGAEHCDHDDLDAGLSALQEYRVEAAGIRGQGKHVWLVGDPEDPISPFQPSFWRQCLPQSITHIGSGGHIPFVHSPQAISQAMEQAFSLYADKGLPGSKGEHEP